MVFLQQVIISALSENVARIAPVFDAQGHEIQVKSKTKVTYESQGKSLLQSVLVDVG